MTRNDKSDGVFGKKTEAGVKALQKYLGLKQTGVLTEDLQTKLWDLYYIATGVMSGDGRDPEELAEIYPAHCSWEGRNEWGGIFCYRHLQEQWLTEYLDRDGAPKKLSLLLHRQLCVQWETDILAMYDEWEEALLEEDKEDVAEERRTAFEEALEALRAEQSGRPELEAAMNEEVWLQLQGIDLCLELHGTAQSEEAEDGADTEAE